MSAAWALGRVLTKGESMDSIEKGNRPLSNLRQGSAYSLADAIEVDSVAQEYEIISRQRCDCGGAYQLKRQSLLAYQDGRYDLIETECEVCHEPRDLLFDISGLLGVDKA